MKSGRIHCELQGYRPPSSDSYGWARICQVVGNFFGGTLSVGIGPYTNDAGMDPGDNGIYVIEGWRIAERLTTEYAEDWKLAGVRDVEPCEEQRSYDFDEMLRSCMWSNKSRHFRHRVFDINRKSMPTFPIESLI